MPLPRRFVLFLVVVALPLAAFGEAPAASGSVDTTEALVIGTYKLSSYRVEKNYRRYITPMQAPGAPSVTPEMTRAWFAHFLAEQVLTAQALKEGYGERPEVAGEVEHMERHMLTQYAGPFYERLYAADSAASPVTDPLSESQQNAYEADILRVPKEAPMARRLSADVALKPAADYAADVAAIGASGQADYYSGTTAWPFAPFEEIAGVIGTAPVGQWQKRETDDELLVFRVRNVRPAERLPASYLAELKAHVRQREIQADRQRRIVREAGLAFDWAAGQRWVDTLAAAHPDPLRPLDTAMAGDLLTVPIASYSDAGTRRTVTVADYIRYYNEQYVRFLPRRSLDVFDSVRAMVVEQRDEHDARVLGVDREPKFVEDRINYRAALALELYVKEKVRPALGITETDVARYYAANTAAFTKPTEVEGSLVTFGEIGDAVAFARAPAAVGAEALLARGHSQKLTLTRTTTVPGWGDLPNLVFSGPRSRVLGPFPTDGAFTVWVFGRVSKSETQPLAAVSQEIRSRLEQPRLEPYEAELAEKLSRDVPIEDRIAYDKYGVGENVVKPWRRS